MDTKIPDSNELRNLAFRWAPVNYQHINLNKRNHIFNLEKRNEHYNTKQDLIVPVNMECYKTNTNKEIGFKTEEIRDRLDSLEISQLTPVVYYSIAITKNHYYLLYSFYHADDTTHANDMEGCLIIVEKRDHGGDQLLGMITIAHEKFPKYSYRERLQLKWDIFHKPKDMFVENDEVIEQDNQQQILSVLRPLIQQESGKHGLYGLGNPLFRIRVWRWLKSIVGFKSDIIVYFPGNNVKKYKKDELIKFKGTTHYATFYYDLVSITDPEQGLWHRREEVENKRNSTFDEDKKFHGDGFHKGEANPPWNWVHDKINVWENPARLLHEWFKPKNGMKPFIDENSTTSNPHYDRKMSDILTNHAM